MISARTLVWPGPAPETDALALAHVARACAHAYTESLGLAPRPTPDRADAAAESVGHAIETSSRRGDGDDVASMAWTLNAVEQT